MVGVAQQTGMSSIVLKTNGLKLKIKAGHVVEASRRDVAAPAAAPNAIGDGESEEPVAGHIVTAPMVGTYYRSTSPSDPPLVQVGDRVDAGQLIGIIEAMKIMNEITADRSGTVLEVIAQNATAVEYGSPLIRLGP
jgi:acetyl-CoA carboxylase biotin carboxyl carrier protein